MHEYESSEILPLNATIPVYTHPPYSTRCLLKVCILLAIYMYIECASLHSLPWAGGIYLPALVCCAWDVALC